MVKEYVVYKLTSPVNKIYIGQTINFKRRMSEYPSESKKHNFKIQKAIRKYGWKNFKKEILEEKIAEDKIDDLERYYIKEFNSIENGYNIELGGHRSKISLNSYKKKIGAKKVFCYDCKGNFIKSFLSLHDASKEMNVDRRHITKCCKNQISFNSVKGFVWSFEKMNKDEVIRKYLGNREKSLKNLKFVK